MTTYTISINENTKKGRLLLEILKDYSIDSNVASILSSEDNEILENITQGLEEVSLIKQGQLKPKSLEESLNEI